MMKRFLQLMILFLISIGCSERMVAQQTPLKKARDVVVRKTSETDVSVQFLAVATSTEKIVRYQWKTMPIVSSKTQSKNVLTLSKLKPGQYKIKVTVTNSEGFTYSSPEFSYTKVYKKPPTVVRPIQGPPPPIVVKPAQGPPPPLPILRIEGPHEINESDSSTRLRASVTNKVAISRYRWEQTKGSQVVLRTRLSEHELELKDIMAGEYEFKLTVTDSIGRTSQTVFPLTVLKRTPLRKDSLIAKPLPSSRPINHAPIVTVTKPSQTIRLPTNMVVIDSKAFDSDGTIKSYHWEKVMGPRATIRGERESSINIKDMEPGRYTFRVKVTDNIGDTGFATAYVLVEPLSPTQPLIVKPKIAKLRGGPENAFLDLILPGLGHYKVSGDYTGKHRKPGIFFISLAYLGSAGGAAYFKIESINDYQTYTRMANYRETQTDASGAITGVRGGREEDAQKYYDRAQSSNKNFITLASVAGGILVSDFIYTIIRGSKNKRAFLTDYNLSKKVFYNSELKQVNFGLTIAL